MLQHAFKEWAVICRALAEGRQALILRKGGIAEAGGRFEVEHTRFWLFPTYTHQQRQRHQARRPAAAGRGGKGASAGGRGPPVALRRGAGRLPRPRRGRRPQDRQPAPLVRGNGPCSLRLPPSGALRHAGPRLPRPPGSRACPTPTPTPAAVAGSSWHAGLPTEGSVPVLDDRAFRELLRTLDAVLNPTAFA